MPDILYYGDILIKSSLSYEQKPTLPYTMKNTWKDVKKTFRLLHDIDDKYMVFHYVITRTYETNLKRLDDTVKRLYFILSLCNALNTLYVNNMYHGDLKAENVGFDDKYNCIFIDHDKNTFTEIDTRKSGKIYIGGTYYPYYLLCFSNSGYIDFPNNTIKTLNKFYAIGIVDILFSIYYIKYSNYIINFYCTKKSKWDMYSDLETEFTKVLDDSLPTKTMESTNAKTVMLNMMNLNCYRIYTPVEIVNVFRQYYQRIFPRIFEKFDSQIAKTQSPIAVARPSVANVYQSSAANVYQSSAANVYQSSAANVYQSSAANVYQPSAATVHQLPTYVTHYDGDDIFWGKNTSPGMDDNLVLSFGSVKDDIPVGDKSPRMLLNNPLYSPIISW
jgi:hypothetical protein